jgi:hypothetical protein
VGRDGGADQAAVVIQWREDALARGATTLALKAGGAGRTEISRPRMLDLAPVSFQCRPGFLFGNATRRCTSANNVSIELVEVRSVLFVTAAKATRPRSSIRTGKHKPRCRLFVVGQLLSPGFFCRQARPLPHVLFAGACFRTRLRRSRDLHKRPRFRIYLIELIA